MHCIHYASSLYGKLGDEMTGRFNQDLPENIHTAFEKATNFELHIITKQSINKRRVHDINNIEVTQRTSGIQITKVRTMILITSKIKTSTIIAAQEPATKTMETKAKEITTQRTPTRRSQSTYQSR